MDTHVSTRRELEGGGGLRVFPFRRKRGDHAISGSLSTARFITMA